MRESNSSTLAAVGQGEVLTLEDSSFGFRLATLLRKVSRQAGWIVLFLLFLSPGPIERNYGIRLVLGLPWWVLAVAVRVWARGYHRSEGFVLNGPYRYVRNPVGLGAMLAYVGAVILLGVPLWWGAIALTVAFLYLSFLASAYEKELILMLGPSYFRYCRRVRRWMPSWLPGVNRAIRTYSVAHGLRYEVESLVWLVGFGVVYGLHSKFGSVWP